MASNEEVARLQQEFEAISDGIQRTLTSIAASKSVEQQSKSIDEAELQITKGNRKLAEIDAEVPHISFNKKEEASRKLRQYRETIEKHKKALKGFKSALNQQASTMPTPAEQQREWREQRQRLLDQNSVIDETGSSLKRVQMSIEESEQIGAATSAALVRDTETMENMLDSIKETDGVLERSKKLLNRMRRRVVTNKVVTGVIVLLELGLVGLIIWYRYYR